MTQKAECQIRMGEVLGSMLTGITFWCWIPLFLHSKVSDTNIVIIANFMCL